ncbi:MAG: hypothetical protein RIS35_2619, partial [Pseudomonadota bacterium]
MTLQASTGKSGPMVYVVDDDEAVRDSILWLLEANDFQVRVFPSAEDFLEMIQGRTGPEPVSCL